MVVVHRRNQIFLLHRTISYLGTASGVLAMLGTPHMWLLVGFSSQGFCCRRSAPSSCFVTFFLTEVVT